MLEIVSDASKESQVQEEKFTNKLEKEKEVFVKELKELAIELHTVKGFSDYKAVKDSATGALALMEKYEKAAEKVKNFNERELIFKQPLTEYFDLDKMISDFHPYHQLWGLAMEFDLEYHEWMNGPFMKSLYYPVIEKKVNQTYYKETLKLQKIFGELDDRKATEVAQELRTHIEKFRECLWLIELLTTEAMTKPTKSIPHWK